MVESWCDSLHHKRHLEPGAPKVDHQVGARPRPDDAVSTGQGIARKDEWSIPISYMRVVTYAFQRGDPPYKTWSKDNRLSSTNKKLILASSAGNPPSAVEKCGDRVAGHEVIIRI